MSGAIFFAPLRVPVIDLRTGLMNREWILFFQAMYLRIGGTTALSNEDLQIAADVDDATEDGIDLRTYTADLERAIGLIDEPQSSSAADVVELQALSASFAEDPIIARFTAQWDGLTPASGGGTLKFLRADGAWAVPAYPAVPVGANPSASVGLAAVNGAAVTFMRSDAAPPLDQTIGPTWTGQHLWTKTLYCNASGAVAFALNSSGTNFAQIQNDGPNTWSLATGAAAFNTLGTPIFSWSPTGVIIHVAQTTGWGTPTGTGVIANFPGGGPATLAQCSQALAQIIKDMKTLGLYGA